MVHVSRNFFQRLGLGAWELGIKNVGAWGLGLLVIVIVIVLG
jgi:hypothetical protein